MTNEVLDPHLVSRAREVILVHSSDLHVARIGRRWRTAATGQRRCAVLATARR